ncbi:MAG TPA: ABC transporter ATP-binding protein [Candidatus Paceibacterota bacterium]|nr:ABC transporter ATP-binding protein [Candidatus Paceibacterota bacterium]
MTIIDVQNLVKTFRSGAIETRVLKGIDLAVPKGEWLSIMGRSGAGKSTLMYQMSLLDDPTSGKILIEGREVHGMSEREKMNFRLFKFGYVFQDYALLPELTALENVVVPLLMENLAHAQAQARAGDALTKVGLGERFHNLPSQLSGGEQQRVSIARAIAESPDILFADEPTANLDRESSLVVMDIFRDLHREGQTIIMVTHEEEYGALADRRVRLDDGRIISDERLKNAHGNAASI